ncbi:zinc finger domain-containing protein [Vibrio chemaguriensis]
MNIYSAAIFVKMSPCLLTWLTKNAPKQGESEKLGFKLVDSQIEFEKTELIKFVKYLSSPWPSKVGTRPNIPVGIKDEIKNEASHKCAICSHTSGEFAHIDPVHNSKNNHPHNLIYLCPNCHDQFDNKKNITDTEIRKIKSDILSTRISIWRSHEKTLDTTLSLINELAVLRDKASESNNRIYKDLEDEVVNAVEQALPNVSVEVESILVNNLNSILQGKHSSDDLIQERARHLRDTHKENCPLCKGCGVYKSLECPVCNGVGIVSVELLSEIDLSPYEQEECPLCKGKGSHNEWECPICRGVGTVDVEAISEIDLSPFEQEECPLCKGKGSHNEWECPICRGVGTVDVDAISEIDLSPFEQEECPLCKGKGSHNECECPICKGIGTVDKSALEIIDLSYYE